ncbi:hypothetical protein MMYC01_206114 [Madurella mycetomatis]|uniref:Trafficking protein particle complex II-specific subunit 65 IgD3 domain-containing protein n=1 Tax=Madurella mycetomatis TaxID=100816 RepID=A0A175W1B8_9PEZI|nr:hypothetical protein MMYC01_206114 [Madurella mycetomatis]
MALPDPDSIGPGDADIVADAFLQQSYLTYIIPFATNFDPEDALGRGEGSVESKISNIEQRDRLFFDETVDVYLILRAPCADEHTFRLHLRRIVVTLDAHIVNSVSSGRDTPPASEIIYSGMVEDVEQAFVVAGEPPDGGEKHFYALWKLSVLLGRPRIRLQLPSALFSGAASLRPPAPDQHSGLRDGYMASCTPSGMNLLEAFANDPMLGGVEPRLSAQRVSRVAPVTKPKDALQRINGLQNLKLKIYPVLHTRVRFSRPNTATPSAALIALLEIDFTPFFDCEVFLDKIHLSMTDGTVEDLNTQDGISFPLSCVAHDHLTFLYKLSPQQLDRLTKTPPSQDLNITIQVLVLVRPEGEPNPCTPRLLMTQPIQRSHRPSQLSISGGVDAQSLVSPSVSQPDALPSLEAAAAAARTVETALPDFGVTMTFTGPPGPIRLGEEFVWSVFVVNRSRPDHHQLPAATAGPPSIATPAPPTATASRKLMLFPIPRRARRNELRVIRPPSTATGGGGGGGAAAGSSKQQRDPLIADAVLDETVVHSMQRSSVVDCAEMVCLSADVRVGPLAPDACAVAELRFLALREGVVGVEAVRVVDLGSQEHVDVRDLPLVVVVSDEVGGVKG